ncbi:hypothetical protein CVU83_00470 [Candidatus Falkowbacteria bacterium HGW-Falkowbacteria-2]|uniref:Adenylosuccinate synthetase n=1 Tax=Candidatus Falkowbacteria bacterium HGW-Falkowbacteria-2 TaxID=2013769 RepID=A0A2N2E3E8_9BACT|nr:MAG: hypothetical protein CVU83_00470 [Candidatus Falkowbacteria bacterium HGW-Falkowbacteria-2]
MKKNRLEDENVKTIAITCLQFGDTGKGKFVDLYADWADIIIRGTGGDNAGHTICANGKTYVTHLIPSGIFRKGKINIIGSGTVVNPKSIIEELNNLGLKGLNSGRLMISMNAGLILPMHIAWDKLREYAAGRGKIGSTGKGIGPAYADRIDRYGLTMNDILNPTIFRKKVKRYLAYKAPFFKTFSAEARKLVMNCDQLNNGFYYDFGDENIIDENVECICEKYLEYAEILRPMIADTDSYVRSQLGIKNILLEGSQGALLSIDKGTYPFVTSSDCTVAGLAKGAGLKESDVDKSFGIAKAPLTSRVGKGSFPSEIGGDQSEAWCNGEGTRELEEKLYGDDVNAQDEFLQGVALRKKGFEYGATTKRPRRVGWLDLPLLRYVLQFSSPDVIFTKLDVLDECKVIKICKQYRYCGETVYHGNRKIRNGDILDVAMKDDEILSQCECIYEEFPGWLEDITACREYSDLPQNLRNILDYVIAKTGCKLHMISVGPDREQTIFVPEENRR